MARSLRLRSSNLVQWILTLALLSLCDGQCSTCSVTTNVACISTTEFQFCVNGMPNSSVVSCPAGYVCSGLDAAICQPNQDGVFVACGDCNICNTNGIFACTGIDTYALCLGGTTPSTTVGSCGTDFVCNIELPQICGNASLGVGPSCSPTTATTTTTTTTTVAAITTISPLQIAQQYCRSVQQNGRFPYESNANARTCKQYIYCALNGGTWFGQLFTCPGRTYFDSTARLCIDAIPASCATSSTTNTVVG